MNIMYASRSMSKLQDSVEKGVNFFEEDIEVCEIEGLASPGDNSAGNEELASGLIVEYARREA